MGRAIMIVVVMALLMGACSGREFDVGGRKGWAANPAEPFSLWAERNRFQVNDTLVFRFNKGEDSVLVVEEKGYRECNTSKAITRLEDGNSTFLLSREGPFFFISGVAHRCQAGEKLAIVVLSSRHRFAPSPSPSLPPSAATPETGSASTQAAPLKRLVSALVLHGALRTFLL
ncbi:early nodulin-like protein 3 [Wolffia australiana]